MGTMQRKSLDMPDETRTIPNGRTDIWNLGDNRVGCGDGRDVAFLKAVVGHGAEIDAAFLDPPYNVRINGHANATGRHREFVMASGEMSDVAFVAFLKESLSACASSLHGAHVAPVHAHEVYRAIA